ncbi:MAG: hypothetical protein Q4D62_10120 [Planctomycetia bacterium]|nr:hypothetical protein [Planctomycetia bacterium]
MSLFLRGTGTLFILRNTGMKAMNDSTIQQRHTFRRQMFRATLIWAVGNALVTSYLVLYLLAAQGIPSGWFTGLVFAGPTLGILLRGLTPLGTRFFRGKKRFVTAVYLAQVVFLAGMLLAACPGMASEKGASFLIILFWYLACWCEQAGFVGYLAWQKELFPPETRGRFYGNLERWKLVGEMSGYLLSIGLIQIWKVYHTVGNEMTIAYGITLLGILFLLGWLYFLKDIPERGISWEENLSRQSLWQQLAAPFTNRTFGWLLLYGGCFSCVTHLCRIPQVQFPREAFPGIIGLAILLSFQMITKMGQGIVAPRCGAWLDRYGVVRLMVLSQAITALGPLFYLRADQTYWWWFYGPSFCWIAYVGLNVGLPKVQLQMAGREDASSWLAAYGLVSGMGALTGLLAGGHFFDLLRSHFSEAVYPIVFSFSSLARLVMCVPLFYALRTVFPSPRAS